MLEPTGASQLSSTQKPTLQPMGFTDILDEIFSLYRDHFKLFLSIAAVYHIPQFANELLDAFFFHGRSSPKMLLMKSAFNFSEYFVGCFVLRGLVYASMQAYLGKRITARDAFRQVLRRFLPCFYSWLFVFFILAFLMVLIMMSIGSPNGVNFVLLLLVSLLAIYFIIRWLFYGMSVLFEDATAKNALRRSSESEISHNCSEPNNHEHKTLIRT